MRPFASPSRSELERFFFPDDADRELIGGKRRSHNSLGFAVQLTTARYLEVFLDYPTDMPAEVVDYLAEQLNVEHRSAGGAGLPVDRVARRAGIRAGPAGAVLCGCPAAR